MGIARKDCAFQYFAEGHMIEDTGLISRDDAEQLWEEHGPDFTKQAERGEEAEMALWVEMQYEGNFQRTAKRVSSVEVIVKDGRAFTMEPVFAR